MTFPRVLPVAAAVVALALSVVAVPTGAGAAPIALRCAAQSGGAQHPLGHITDVRVGTHRHFDRFVVEFRGSRIPHYTLTAKGNTTFHLDPSDRRVHLRGSVALKLVFSHATGVDSYNGPSDFRTGFPELKEARLIGDFEAVTTAGLGLGHPVCALVSTLHSPSRLVIDVRH
jgi:hypothetical protein